MTGPTKHAVLSPSGSHKWMDCPGSAAMESKYPDDESEYAAEGTAAHEVASWCLAGERDAVAFLHRVIKVGKFEFRVDRGMAGHVQTYVDAVRERAQGHELHVEVSLPVDHITGEQGARGTGDAVVIRYADKEIEVNDLKYGQGVRVDAEKNPQLMLYALGALEEFGVLCDFERARMVIHQPRLGAVSEWSCSIEELRQFGEEAQARAKHATACFDEHEDALIHHLRPGDHCREGFCKARHACPALAKRAQFEALMHFEDLEATGKCIACAEAVCDDCGAASPITGEKIKAPTAAPVPDDIDELAKKYSLVPMIEDWCRQVSAAFEARLLNGEMHPDFKVVAGKRGNRQWTSNDEAEQVLKSMRLKHDQIYEYKVISPTSAEKLAKAGEIGERQWKKLQQHITQAPGKPSVVPASDSRAALEVRPAVDEFDDLGDAAPPPADQVGADNQETLV